MSSSLSGRKGPSGSNIPKGYAAGSIQQFSPEQMGLFKSLFSQVSPGSKLAGLAGGDEAAFAPMEQQAMRDFQSFSGQNASRFSGLGMGARRGSGFQNAQTQGTQDFALQLANQRQGLQRQALQDLMGMSGMLLGQHPQENFLVKKDLPFWQQMGLGAVGGAGNALGSLVGGLFGRRPQQQQAQWQPMQ